MTQRKLCLLLLTLLLSIVALPPTKAPAVLAATAALLNNGSFEEGAFTPSGAPTGWTKVQYNPGRAQFLWDDSQAHSGGKSVKISTAQPDDARWTQNINLQPYTSYELSGWIRTENVPLDGGATLAVESSSDAFLARSARRSGTTDWSYVRVVFGSGAATQVTVGARLGDYGGMTTGVAWFDDMRLAVLTLPANASFEEGDFAPTASPTNWARDFFAPHVRLQWDDQIAHSGVRSVNITMTERNQAAWVQLVPVQPQTAYRLSGWIKTENVAHTIGDVNAGANLAVVGVKTRLAQAIRSPGLFGTTAWTQVQVDFNSNEETQLLLELQLGQPFGLTSGTAWFDDIQLIKTNGGNSDSTDDPAAGITLRLRADNYRLAKEQDGLDLIQIDGFTRWGAPGDPLLPSAIYAIALPPDVVEGSVQVELKNVLTREIPGRYTIAPAPPYITSPAGQTLVDWGENAGVVTAGRHAAVYDRDAFFPSSPIRLRTESQLRKWRFVSVQFIPVQYNPVTKSLNLIEEVTVQLTFTRDTVRSATLDALLTDSMMNNEAASLFYNFAQAKAWYPLPSSIATTKPGYAIITVDNIVSNSTQLDDFVAHKQAVGYEVYIVTETQYDKLTGQAPNGRAEKIRRWLIDNYVSKALEAVLLIGDPNPDDPSDTPDYPEAGSDLVGDVPMKMCWPRRTATTDSIYSQQSPTDYFYADLTGNWDKDGDRYFCEYDEDGGSGGVDFAPELYVGRIPVYRAQPNWQADLDSILAKLIAYELASDTAWRRSALLTMAIDHADSAEALRNDYLAPLGFSAYRLYERDTLPNCDATHDFPVDQPLTENAVRTYWQDHPTGLVLWAGHGWANGTALCTGANLFHTDDAALLNDARPAFTYQNSCETGWPEQPTNVGAALLRHGAIGTVAASRISWAGEIFVDHASASSIGYHYLSRLARNQTAGMALYLSKGLGLHVWGTNEWQNLFDFNLYGEPTSHLLPIEQWGKVAGAIRGLGYCDAEAHPLVGATLTVHSAAEQSWTGASDATGQYSLWVKQDGAPYALSVTYPAYVSRELSAIPITTGATTVVDADLRWQHACSHVSPQSLTQRIGRGQQITETLTIANQGAGMATFTVSSNADWLSVTPTQGAIAADAMQTLVVTLDARMPAVAQPGDYTAKLTVTTNDPQQPTREIPVTMTVLLPAVTLTPDAQTLYGDPGATVVYPLQVHNTGNDSDTYRVTVGEYRWSVNAPATVGPLAADASTTLTVAIQIPVQALAGASDRTTLQLIAQSDASRSATSTLTTIANPVSAVSCDVGSNGQAGAPQAAIIYQATVTNQGNITDTFALTVSGNQWPTTLPASVGPLQPGASTMVTVTVTIPAGIAVGASDTALVTVIAQHDQTKSATVALTTTAQVEPGPTYRIFLPVLAGGG